MVEFCLTLFLSFPGCAHPGFLVGSPPSPGCDCSGLVTWLLLAPRSWKSPCQSAPFARSVALGHWCGGTMVSPLFPHLVRRNLAYGLTVSPLPHYRIHGQASAGLICWVSALEVLFVVIPRQLVGSGVYSPASPIALLLAFWSGVPSGSLLQVSRWGHPFGSSLSQSSIGTKALPPPSWCLVRVFAMGSPCRVGVVPDLDRNEDFLHTFPGGWCLAFAMGSPISGRVALFCALDWNEGFFLSSILSCFAMGSPCWSSVWFPTLNRNEAGFG